MKAYAAGRGRRTVLVVLVAATLVAGWSARSAAAATPLEAMAAARAQMHRNASRGVPYLPLARQGDSPGAPALSMAPWKTIELDGNPLPNVYSNLRPIDVDGDGTYEFVQFNGTRFLQVWTQDGRKLWRIFNPDGRLHDYGAGTQRDTLAVLDVDGDGKQDIVHCWDAGGRRALVARRGLTGRVIRSVALEARTSQECQIAAFRTAPAGQVQILVAHNINDPTWSSCPHNFVGYWSRTVAFDAQLRQIWERNTCDAGHYAWPLDQDYDGLAEAMFVGKYLLRPDGSVQCSLGGWPAADHADGLAVADLDAARPGLEAVAVGRTGVAGFEAATCRPLWRVPTAVLRDPQHVAVAKLDPAAAAPQIVVDERGSQTLPRTFLLDGQGRVLSARNNGVMAMQNANLDGALGVDEAVGSFGTVTDRFGNVRLTRWWYWRLKGTRVVETNNGPYPSEYDRWQAFPLVLDVDRDGRDEIVTWGQSLIVIGKAR